MNIYKAVEWINSLNVADLPYTGITSITCGTKTKNNVNTGEPCIVFGFLNKKPLQELSAQEIVPATLLINGEEVLTDIIEKPISQHLAARNCHVLDPYTEPVKSNRQRRRPLMGGASSIYIGGTDATLGLMVTDKTDGQVVALSNCHVYGASQILAYYSNSNGAGFTNTYQISARQPGTNAYNPWGNVTPSVDYIGNCKRAVPIGNKDYTLYFNTYINDTSCDAAILSLSSYTTLIDIVSSKNVVGFNVPGPYQFATDTEITSLLDPASLNYGAPIFRSGRTVGPVGYPGNNYSCRLSVSEFGLELVGTYSGYASFFSNCFTFVGQEYPDGISPGAGGDSGSAVFALLSANSITLSAWKAIGLLFAGPNAAYPQYSIGCRITKVMDDLDVVPWNGVIPTLSATTQLVTLSSSQIQPWSTSAVITLSGRKYYQLGRA